MVAPQAGSTGDPVLGAGLDPLVAEGTPRGARLEPDALLLPAHPALAPSPLGRHDHTVSGTALRCAVCHDDLGQREERCAGCGTRVHPECQAMVAGCPTLGCVGAALRVAGPDPKSAPLARRTPLRRLLWLAIGAAAAVVGLQVWLQSQDWWLRRSTIEAARELAQDRDLSACDALAGRPEYELRWLCRRAGILEEMVAHVPRQRLLSSFADLDEPQPTIVLVHQGRVYLYFPNQERPGWDRLWIVCGPATPPPAEIDWTVMWWSGRQITDGVYELIGPSRD